MKTTSLFRRAPHTEFYLASSSPRRKELLASLGLDFKIVPAQNPEPEPLPGESAKKFALRAARYKSCQPIDFLSDERLSTKVVIAADTVVCLNDHILGKPENSENAFNMLRLLNGKTHKVHTALCVRIYKGSKTGSKSFVNTSSVEFALWPERVLQAYANLQEPLDKAGAYAVQGIGAFLIRTIKGSWTNVVGLPLETLASFLLARQLVCLRNGMESEGK